MVFGRAHCELNFRNVEFYVGRNWLVSDPDFEKMKEKITQCQEIEMQLKDR